MIVAKLHMKLPHSTTTRLCSNLKS